MWRGGGSEGPQSGAMSWNVLVLCIFALASATPEQEAPPLVRVRNGLLKGRSLDSDGGRGFFAFSGVPYAAPPLGELRFKEPQPARDWEGVWDATRRKINCIQFDHLMNDNYTDAVKGEEDCLYLNIYTPKLPVSGQKSPNLDVLVFIHPGAFMFGGGDWFGPMRLMDRDVVLVTLNYRLGILGFLSTGDSVLPGNNGMKDQVAALRWVKDNVAAFGGNPSSVTIAGMSAGGASVHLHLLSPLSRGLFHRAISQSGTALSPWANAEKLREKAFRLGEVLGCPSSTSEELVNCLRHRPAGQIVDTTRIFQKWLYNPFSPLAPTVEPDGNNAFISKDPALVLQEKNVIDVPWMCSVTTAEGLYPIAEIANNPELLEELNDRFNDIAPEMMHYRHTVSPDVIDATSETIRRYYFGDKKISPKTVKELTTMVGDRLYVVSAARSLHLHSAAVSSPVYAYVFNYRGENSLSDTATKTKINFGVSHGDDTGYIFNTSFSHKLNTEADKAMSKFLIDQWVSFMRTGSPAAKDVWSPVNRDQSESVNYLQIEGPKQFSMKVDTNMGNILFWDRVPDRRAQTLTSCRRGSASNKC